MKTKFISKVNQLENVRKGEELYILKNNQLEDLVKQEVSLGEGVQLENVVKQEEVSISEANQLEILKEEDVPEIFSNGDYNSFKGLYQYSMKALFRSIFLFFISLGLYLAIDKSLISVPLFFPEPKKGNSEAQRKWNNEQEVFLNILKVRVLASKVSTKSLRYMK